MRAQQEKEGEFYEEATRGRSASHHLQVKAALAGLRVDKLRIADGSIMPRVTTGNTMAPCVIIGERAAEVLRTEHKLHAIHPHVLPPLLLADFYETPPERTARRLRIPNICCQWSNMTSGIQLRQRSACCTSEFVEQLSLELCIVDSGMRLHASLMMPIPSASKRFRIIASSKPLLSKMSQPQVIWRIMSPHFGGYPARIDRVAENVRPNSSDGCGKGRHEKLAVRVGTSGSATSPVHAT